MNEYERLFAEIVQQTKDGSLQWRQVRRTENAELLLNADTVIRQFEATFTRNSHPYKLLLLEKRVEDEHFFWTFQQREPELHVVDDGELVTSLDRLYIDANEIRGLLGLVEPRADRSYRLFGTVHPGRAASQT
ncbi:hypothetical protein [Massilia endophytica]|uniref:hypothetical protein n=1 Tax=Massilia endophytica TaxID=2899220 RepID=UPI001E3AD9B4|nr:hypothetical protein [Massilia endophytica]UGQ44707.1 hypothetical protein LSQ66_12925 [Massilia endophytica]